MREFTDRVRELPNALTAQMKYRNKSYNFSIDESKQNFRWYPSEPQSVRSSSVE